MSKDGAPSPAPAISSRPKAAKNETTAPKIATKRLSLLLVSYVATISTILQSQMNASTMADAPFLTHVDLDGNGGGGGSVSCSQRTHRALLPRLVARMNEDPRANALVPLDVPLGDDPRSGNATTSMPGLHLASFRGRRIAFLGDSTLFYMAKWLVSMLRHEDVADDVAGEKDRDAGHHKLYHTMNLGQANAFVRNHKQLVLDGTEYPPPYRKVDEGTWFQFWGMAGNSHGRTEELLNAMFQDAEAMKPQIIVANMA